MVFHIIVENFGKVEYADIALTNLVVLVGNNNSGKTMIMQLIYGIRNELMNMSVPTEGVEQSSLGEQTLIRCGRNWFTEVEAYVNRYLADNKMQIMQKIFGVPVDVETIKISLENDNSLYYVCSASETVSDNVENPQNMIELDILRYDGTEEPREYTKSIDVKEYREDEIREIVQSVWTIMLSGNEALNAKQLFLPASRAGLQMLYRYYFAGDTKGNLVLPVRDFLKFLQLYAQDAQLDDARRTLVEFGEEFLLKGRIIQKGEETFFTEGQNGRIVPLYVASSMIHELTPFIKALNSTQQIGWIFCDEVENSLHPLLQREMARWVIRMVNEGMNVVISSHSDTMASRLNNLLMLTFLGNEKVSYSMLKELELTQADMLKQGIRVSVYEFHTGKQGRTAVEKLDFIDYPLMGYDFKLFGKNLDKLYDEAERITR
ncbi:MAG: AAA family ATPase [Roseburia sp.]